MSELQEKVLNGEYIEIQEHKSEDISKLVLSMLSQDPNARPDLDSILSSLEDMTFSRGMNMKFNPDPENKECAAVDVSDAQIHVKENEDGIPRSIRLEPDMPQDNASACRVKVLELNGRVCIGLVTEQW